MAITAITSYKTSDGQLFEQEHIAAAHEDELSIQEHVKALFNQIYRLGTHAGGVDFNDGITNAFRSKNTRNIIRSLLQLTAEPGND